MRFLIAMVAFVVMSSGAFAADQGSSYERYNSIKEETKNTGSVGFDKRHKSYRDYIMGQRRQDGLADIAPAAGNENSSTNKKVTPEAPSKKNLND